MIIRKSHLSSICLMALASTIAITEYATYTPTILPDVLDSELPQPQIDYQDESNESIDESNSESGTSTEKDLSSLDISDGEADVANDSSNESADPFSPSGQTEVKINSGDTLATALSKLGFDKTDIYLASKSLSKVFNLRNLKIGQTIVVKGSKDESGDLTLTGLELKPDYKTKIVVSKNDSGYNTEKIDVPVKKVMRSISGVIAPKSPEYSLVQCGVASNVSADALRGLSQIVNIRSSKTPVDFELLYQDYFDDDGKRVRKPELLYASVFIGGKIKRIYKFSYGNFSEFIDSNGVILKTLAKSRSMLNQPLGRMKITSKFGIRRHPISGKIKGHTGVDLSAPVGTPIRAAASGTVMRASHYSGYGRYINIKHSKAISTAYAHLSRIVVRSGQHVSQGQIIGYTGNSGNSTGPHLHYEVLQNGHPINPMSFVKQDPQKLSGDKLYKFNQFKKQVNLQVVGLNPSKNKNVKVGRLS